jgi:membrane protease YdiL (CAAX protease family)
MSTAIRILRNINPLKESQKCTKVEYVISKVLAFLLIYLSAAVIIEGIVMLIFYFSGYNFLHGEIPQGEWVNLLPLYGFIGFAALTMLYVKLIEKQSLASIKLEWNLGLLKAIVKGFAIGSILVVLLIIILLSTGNYKFTGIGKINETTLIWLFAYIIQGASEELMCRGFLQNSLNRRVSTVVAILISGGAFIFPHISSILDRNGISILIAFINLFLVSTLFSLAMLKENSIGAACGIHIGWNFFLGNIFGLQVSGGASVNGVFQFVVRPEYTWLTGGTYGIEASALLVPILLILDITYIKQIKRRCA